MATDDETLTAPEPETETDDTQDPEALHERALDRFTLCEEAFHDQRAREIDDLRFVDEKGAQWPDDIRAARGGQQAGGGFPAIGARPCLEFNLLRGPVQQVINTARQARLGLSFAPEGEDATREIAQAYDDIARAIQTDSRAHVARQWAFERAAKCGWGAYRILTEYVNDRSFDQKIIYKRILNQAAVYLDPFAQEPDWSDGQFALLTQDLPFARYQRSHPDTKLASYSDRELTSLGNDIPGWISTTHGDAGMAVRVAEYWDVREESRTLILLPDMTTAFEDEIPAAILATVEKDRGLKLPRRTIRTGRRVFWALINGVEVIEGPQEWNGSFIPIIPVLGDESNINGDRRWTGIVQFARDAQQSYNYMRSAQVEAVGLAPRAPWLIADGQLEGYETWWQQANTRNLPYLPYRLTTYDGRPAPPPTRTIAEPAIQGITIAAQAAKDDLHGTTNLPPVSLGQLDPHERSGVAIRALQGQAEVGTSGYLDNLSSISMLYEGKVLKDLIPRIYDRPGRIVPAIGPDDRRRSVMVNAPFVEQGGKPQMVPPQTPGAQMLDLKVGDLAVQAVVGKSYATRREETADALSAIMQAAPTLAPILAPFWLDELDFPGAKKLASIAKKTLPPQFQEDEQNPQAQLSQMQQQLAQASQMIDLLTKELQAKTHLIETDQVKAEATVQVKQLELASQERIESLKAQVDLLKAEMSVQSKQQTAQLSADSQRQRAQMGADTALSRTLWQSAAQSVNQLEAQAFQKDQQAAQIDANREAQQADLAMQQQQLAQQPPGPPGGPGPQGPAGG
ncbi:MAG TPA: portal protein [Burkholderiales bacterium]|nr:portal protein [Burkholderiales bacterium]